MTSVLVYIIFVDDIDSKGCSLSSLGLVSSLLEFLYKLGGSVRPRTPKDPQLGEVECQELEPRD